MCVCVSGNVLCKVSRYICRLCVEGMNNCIAHILRFFKIEKRAKTLNIKYWCIILVCCGKMSCCFSKRF